MAATDVAPATDKGVTLPTNGSRKAGTSHLSSTEAAKEVLRRAALSPEGRKRFAVTSSRADEVAALATLSGSSDVVSARDIAVFTGISGYSADGSPTWGELATALSS